MFVQNNVYPHVAGKRFAQMITDVWFLIRASPTMTVEQAKFVGGQQKLEEKERQVMVLGLDKACAGVLKMAAQ